MTIRNAVYAPNFNDYSDPRKLVELAVTAEEAGYDGFFLWDHLVFDASGALEVTDATVALSAIAASTRTLRIGAMVTPVARRRPWKLARELVALDRLSAGRLTLGVGLGEPAALEYAAFGEDPEERAGRLDEGLLVLDQLVRGVRVDHDGAYYRVEDMCFLPAAQQSPRFPIWVAASLPARAGVRRSQRFEGLFPVQMPADFGGDPNVGIDWSKWWLNSTRFAALVNEVRATRAATTPFDFVASGRLGEGGCNGEPQALFAQAGATWWCDWVDERPGAAAANLKAVSNGPPA